MGDSFFGFNASMPPLSDAELKELEEEEKKREKSQPKDLDPDRDPEVYDFEALRNELDDEEDYDDNLAAQLSEDNDELNDETFADVPIDQDFDFFGNTERFTANISEEEAFHVKRPVKEEHGASRLGSMKSFELNERRLGKNSVTRESLWGTADRNSSARNVRPASADFRSGQFGLGSKFGEASPVTNTSSIWGGFGGNLSTTTDRSYSPFGSSSGNLSPFNQRQSQPPHQASYTPSPPPGLSPSSSFGHQQQRGQPVRLEDIEAELQRQALAGAAAAARHETGRFHGDDMDPRKVMSLSEVESAIRATGGRVPGAPEAFPLVGQMAAINQMQQAQQQQQLLQEQALRGLSIMDSERLQMMALRQQELAEQMAAEQAAKQQRRQQDQRKSQYNGLMTQQDKDFINRIQLSQLASSDPYSDDFYYQVYSSIRQRAGLPTWSASGNSSENTGRGGRNRKEDGMQRLHQQLQRVLNNAKKHPRQTQVSLEGALGKITSLTVRNPRQVLQVSEKRPSATASAQESDQKTTSGTGKANTPPVYDRRRVLKIVENIYLIVLDLEQMRRQGPPRAKPNQEEEHEEELAQWNETYAEKVKKLWESLRLDDHAEGSASLIISILSVAKGKKLIPRILRHLSSDQSLTLVTLIISNFSQLQVCQNVIYPGTMVANAEEAARQKFVTFDDVELFINTAAPSLLAIISEAPLRVINGLTKLFMEKNNIVSIARTKPGLAFLTMLLSRAESLKQGGGTLTGLPTPSAEDLAEWQQEYTALFSSLQGNYASIFPSLYYLVPIQPTITMAQIALTIDDMYVWQFLAALAIGASMDQQQILVTEVRDRVMENIVLAHSNRLPAAQVTHKISNVNLFLHALGLDSSQVAIPR